jgi:hypothetical protein
MLPPKKLLQKKYYNSRILSYKNDLLQNNIKLRMLMQTRIFNIFRKYKCVTSMNYFSIIYKANLLENILYNKYKFNYVSFLDIKKLESKILKIIKKILFL